MVILLVLASLALDPSLTRLQAEDARVATIAWRLQTANAALCPDTVRVSGLSIHALSQYHATQAAAAAQFGLGLHPGIAAIAPESAAARAGLFPGDAVLAVNDVLTPVVDPRSGYAPVGQTEAMIETALMSGAARLRLAHGRTERTVLLTGDTGCASRVQIVAGRGINARADGRYVQVTAALLDFAARDDDLSVIVGHELAHNILRHRALDTPSKQAEYAADRMGVWLMARAGYDIDAVVPFWTRFEARTNAGIFADGTHPSPKKRLAAVAAAVAEVKAQRAAGQPLIPPSQPQIPR